MEFLLVRVKWLPDLVRVWSEKIERSYRFVVWGLYEIWVSERDPLLDARRDPVTKGLDAVAIRARARDLFSAAARYGHTYTIVFVDLDELRLFNDRYGHAVGDRLLRCFQDSALSTIRSGLDAVGRYGGDEFLILLPNIGFEEARVVMNRLTRKLESKVSITLTVHAAIRFSYGIVELDPQAGGCDLDGCIALADQRMYAHKRSKFCLVKR